MTREQVRRFYAELGRLSGVRFVGLSSMTRVLRFILSAVTRKYIPMLPDLSPFLRPCFVRVGRFEFAFLNFDPGSSTLPLLVQCHVAGHELEHGAQIRKFIADGGTVSRWYAEYFDPDDPEFRALAEGGAIAASGELYFALTGNAPKADFTLGSYFVSTEALELARDRYRDHIAKCRKLGRYSSTFPSSALAIKAAKAVGLITPT